MFNFVAFESMHWRMEPGKKEQRQHTRHAAKNGRAAARPMPETPPAAPAPTRLPRHRGHLHQRRSFELWHCRAPRCLAERAAHGVDGADEQWVWWSCDYAFEKEDRRVGNCGRCGGQGERVSRSHSSCSERTLLKPSCGNFSHIKIRNSKHLVNQKQSKQERIFKIDHR